MNWSKFEGGTKDDFLEFLEGLQSATTLRILFKKNQITDVNELLDRLPPKSEVGYFSLRGTKFLDRDLAKLTQNENLILCGGVHLGGCGITDQGLARFAQSKAASRIKRLYLSNATGAKPGTGNQIGDWGAEAIARSTMLQELEELDFWNTGIGDKGFLSLVESQSLPKLSKINVWGTSVTKAMHDHVSSLLAKRSKEALKPYLFVHTDYNIPVADYFGDDYW